MALNKTVLAGDIESALLAAGHSVDDPVVLEIWTVIAESIINHLTTAGVITIPLGVPVQVVPASGTGATTAPAIGTIG